MFADTRKSSSVLNT